jgi:hypothetical protein
LGHQILLVIGMTGEAVYVDDFGPFVPGFALKAHRRTAFAQAMAQALRRLVADQASIFLAISERFRRNKCRAAYRHRLAPSIRINNLGCRLKRVKRATVDRHIGWTICSMTLAFRL